MSEKLPIKKTHPSLYKDDDCFIDLDTMPDTTWWSEESIQKHTVDKTNLAKDYVSKTYLERDYVSKAVLYKEVEEWFMSQKTLPGTDMKCVDFHSLMELQKHLQLLGLDEVEDERR